MPICILDKLLSWPGKHIGESSGIITSISIHTLLQTSRSCIFFLYIRLAETSPLTCLKKWNLRDYRIQITERTRNSSHGATGLIKLLLLHKKPFFSPARADIWPKWQMCGTWNLSDMVAAAVEQDHCRKGKKNQIKPWTMLQTSIKNKTLIVLITYLIAEAKYQMPKINGAKFYFSHNLWKSLTIINWLQVRVTYSRMATIHHRKGEIRQQEREKTGIFCPLHWMKTTCTGWGEV